MDAELSMPESTLVSRSLLFVIRYAIFNTFLHAV